MIRTRVLCVLAVLFVLSLLSARDSTAAWWETGFDRWYYKDDWKAEFLSGARTFGTTVTIPGDIARAWVEVWAVEYTLYVNGEKVGHDRDPGTIEAYDLTAILHGGRNPIVVNGGPEVIVEGGAVLKDGRIIPIRSDATWGKKIRTSKVRRSGPRGYIGDAHQALMLDYTPEQRAKSAVSRLHSLVGRLRDRGQYRFWQVRDPGEVLRLSGPQYDLWDDVVRDATEATTTAELTKEPMAREDWASVEKVLNAPPRPIAPHLLDTAADLDTAISLLTLRNDVTALRIQLDLLATSGPLAEPSWPPRLLRILNDLALALNPETQDRLRPYLISQTQAELARLRAEIEGRLGLHLDPLNRSTQNRLGWVISNEPMDNDPRRWEFSFAPPSSDILDLAGLWKFSLDPKDEGTTRGFARNDFDDAQWKAIVAPNKWGWERFGYDQDNPLFRGKNNKPYNGAAWYRKRIVIPDAWMGRDLELDLGERGGNNLDWLFVNGEAGGDAAQREKGNATGLFRIPAAMIKTGGPNTLAIRVYNKENCGGLLGPRIQIYPVGSRPERLRTACQAGIVQAAKYAGGARQVAYCGALSPAILVAQTEKQFRVHGWESKGWPAPSYLAYLSGGKEQLVSLKPGFSFNGTDLERPWLLLAPHPDRAKATSSPQTILIILQHRPERVRWEKDAFGDSALVMDFDTSPGVVGLVRRFGPVVPINIGSNGQAALRPFTDSLSNDWATLIRAYPVSYAELYRKVGDKALVQLGYEYFETDDDWKTEHAPQAPVPMLFTYARENSWPGAEVEHAALLSYGGKYTADPSASDCGVALSRIGATHVAMAYDRLEPRVHWKGVGTFAEIRNMTDRDFEQLRSWGANSERPQIAFGANWFTKGFFKNTKRDGLEGERFAD